jgi:hypothetical protein
VPISAHPVSKNALKHTHKIAEETQNNRFLAKKRAFGAHSGNSRVSLALKWEIPGL